MAELDPKVDSGAMEDEQVSGDHLSPRSEPMATEEVEDLGFEEDFEVSCTNGEDSTFDVTVGHIEDIIMEEEFQQIQNQFLEKYYQEFEDTEENKFCYTDIHQEYVNLVEKYILDQLTLRMPNFSMNEFSEQLAQRREELDGEIFEILLTFSDFMAFKEMVLDYRSSKEGTVVDLNSGLTVTSLGSGEPSVGPHVHTINFDPFSQQ